MDTFGLICVMAGGAFGALCRYLAMSAIGKFVPGDFPTGTFIVNITGSFLMGVWIATMAYTMPAKAKDLHLLFAVGVLGGYTTFSTFSLDTFYLIQRGEIVQMAMYVGGSIVLSVLALIAGMWVVRFVF